MLRDHSVQFLLETTDMVAADRIIDHCIQSGFPLNADDTIFFSQLILSVK